MKGKQFITYDDKKVVPNMESYSFSDREVFWINYAKMAKPELSTVEECIEWLKAKDYWEEKSVNTES